MTDIRTTLEHIERRVAMPEPAMERLLRRRERHERRQRIEAAVVGLAVAAGGIVGAVLTLRVAEGTRPAAGEDVGPRVIADGYALPTVAIWTALVVLALTAITVVRLRRRFAHVDLGEEERDPGGAAASARRPATTPGAAPWKGGTDMDSKPTTGAGVPQVEIPEIRFDDGKLRRTNRWLTAAVVALALGVVALGVALIVRSGSEQPAATPPTVDPRTTVIDALSAAWSGTDSAALAVLYAENAVLTTDDGAYEGRDAIVGLVESTDLQIARVSEVIGQRKYAAAVMRLENAYGHAYVLTVWKFNTDGKIVSQQNFYGGS